MQFSSLAIRHPALGLGLRCLLIFAFTIESVIAAEYAAQPNVDVKSEYNTNRSLTTGPHDDVFGATVDLSLNLSGRTETTSLLLTPRLRSQRYDSEEDLDSDDQFLTLEFNHAKPRVSFGLDANLSRDTSLTSELTTVGKVFDRRRRFAVSVTPSLEIKVSPRAHFGLRYNHQDISFDNGVPAGLFDSRQDEVELSGGYSLSPTDEITGLLSATRFIVENDPGSTDFDTLGVSVGYIKNFSETLEGKFEVGADSTTEKSSPFGVSLDSDSLGPTFNVEIKKRFEKTVLLIASEQTRTGISEGAVIEKTGASLSIDHSFSPLWSGQVDILAFRNRSIDDVTTDNDVNFVSVGVGVQRRLKPEWILTGRFQYLFRRDELSSETADSYAVFFSIIYQGQPFSRSR